MNNKTIYLSGPMSNKPDFNFELFNRVTNILREKNLVINPAEHNHIDDLITNCLVNKTLPYRDAFTYYMKRDINFILDKADMIYLLPDWEDSPGVEVELYIALKIKDIPVYELIINKDYIEICKQIKLRDINFNKNWK